MSETSPIKIKVDIISGYLGAGKTTLIKKLISQGIYSDKKLIVLENEFGKINIDGQNLSTLDIEIENITAECICCSGADILVNKLKEISQTTISRHLIIEPTGVARLSDVRRVFQYPAIKELYQINNIITIIDVTNYKNWIKVSKDFFEDQIRFSNVIFISKTDCCSRENIMKLIMMLENIHPDCPIFNNEESLLDSIRTNLPLGEKTASDRFLYFTSQHSVQHFESYTFESNQSINTQKFEQLLEKIKQRKFGEIHRIKGNFQNEYANGFHIELVYKTIQITPIKNSLERNTQICFIGKNIERTLLNNSLNQIIN